MRNNLNTTTKKYLTALMMAIMVITLCSCASKTNAAEVDLTPIVNNKATLENATENTESLEATYLEEMMEMARESEGVDESTASVSNVSDGTTNIVNQPESSEKSAENEQKENVAANGNGETNNGDNGEESSNGNDNASSSATPSNYVGRFKIPSVGVDVACYASNSQATTDAWDSAAYYYGNGHQIIADHVNQGFSAIKSCKEGAMATLETATGTQTYTCIAKINGHNTGTLLTDENGNQIRDMYPGALVAYTCNGNWRNITIVFFGVPGVDYIEPDVDNNESNANNGNNNSNNDTSNDNNNSNETTEPTNKCEHSWGWWIVGDECIDENGYYYGWDVRTCDLCQCEERVVRHTPSFSLSQKLEEERKAKEEAENNATEPSKSVESSENVETEVGDAGIGGESSDVGNYGDTVIPDVNPAGDSTSTGET